MNEVVGRITIDHQVACVRREIRMRERVYPRWVASERMSSTKATEELATMRAVLETLETLAVESRLL